MCSSTFMDKMIHRLRIASIWSEGKRPEGGHPSCLLLVKGFPGHWSSGLTLGMSDDLGSWAFWEWRENKTDSMMITMAAWASFGNSLYFCLKFFKENEITGCLLCVVGPMESTAASVPQPLFWHLDLTCSWCPHKRITTQRCWAWQLEAWLWGSETRFRVLPTCLTFKQWLINLWNSISSWIHLKSKQPLHGGPPERIQ